MKTKKTGEPSMLGWFCFEGRYIHTLLTKAYKFDNDSWDNIHFVKKVWGLYLTPSIESVMFLYIWISENFALIS